MDKSDAQRIIERANELLVGKTVSCSNAMDNVEFARKSKEMAKSHEWLYHCSDISSLYNILKSREFWLSSLKRVNDKEEAARIDVPMFENSLYIGCFTYDCNIPEEHWKEYGALDTGVIIGVKQEWFMKAATFLYESSQRADDFDMFCVKRDYNEAIKYKIDNRKQNRLVNPYYIFSYGFFQVVYDDSLKMNIEGTCSICVEGIPVEGRSLTPSVAAIIKSTHGICCRYGMKPYEKDWAAEKEVRLTIGIKQFDNEKNGNQIHDGTIVDPVYFSRIAVPVSEVAFDEIRIGFSPQFINKKDELEKIKAMMPNSSIIEI